MINVYVIVQILYIMSQGFFCFFGFSRIRRIIKRGGVKDGKMQEFFEEVGIGQFLFRPRYYKMFDSFVRRQLPPNHEHLWTQI